MSNPSIEVKPVAELTVLDKLAQSLASSLFDRSDSSDLPLHASTVPLILVTKSRVWFACRPGEKRELAQLYRAICSNKRLAKQENPRVYSCWPGQWESHVLSVDMSAISRQFLFEAGPASRW